MPESFDARVNAIDCTADAIILVKASDREDTIIFNDSVAADLYIRIGSAAATPTNFSVRLAKGEYFVLDGNSYSGEVHAIWSAADAGKVRVTELV